MSKKTSIIWLMPEDKFIELIKNSPTMSAVLRYFGMNNRGNNYQTCRSRIKELNLDTSHFLNRINSYKYHNSLTKEEFLKRLSENSSCKNGEVKKFLIKFNLLQYRCYECENKGIWNNKKLSLQLEHKNGIHNDFRLENLTFLCPNCHSQTDTFAGKRHKKYYFCKFCGNPTCGSSKEEKCIKCSGKDKRKNCPISKDELLRLIQSQSLQSIARKFNISSHTVEKWCLRFGINYKDDSPFSRNNKIKKEKKIGRIFPSKYLHVSFNSKRNKWIANIKDNKILKFFKRFDTELEAAQAIAEFLNSKDLIVRQTNI